MCRGRRGNARHRPMPMSPRSRRTVSRQGRLPLWMKMPMRVSGPVPSQRLKPRNCPLSRVTEQHIRSGRRQSSPPTPLSLHFQNIGGCNLRTRRPWPTTLLSRHRRIPPLPPALSTTRPCAGWSGRSRRWNRRGTRSRSNVGCLFSRRLTVRRAGFAAVCILKMKPCQSTDRPLCLPAPPGWQKRRRS